MSRGEGKLCPRLSTDKETSRPRRSTFCFNPYEVVKIILYGGASHLYTAFVIPHWPCPRDLSFFFSAGIAASRISDHNCSTTHGVKLGHNRRDAFRLCPIVERSGNQSHQQESALYSRPEPHQQIWANILLLLVGLPDRLPLMVNLLPRIKLRH